MSPRDRFDSLFRYYGEEYGIDWQLLKAQARAESGMDAKAVSPVGAEGLAQFMPATWRDIMGAADPFNPESAIEGQAKYMQQLLAQFHGNRQQALAAYNWGMGHVRRVVRDTGDGWDARLPRETSDYIARIAAYYAEEVRRA